MHSNVRGSYRAKFDDDDLNSFRGIALRGTDTQTDTQTYTHTQTRGLSTLNILQSRLRLCKQTKTAGTDRLS